MKLCTFEVKTSLGRHWRMGALLPQGIIDLNFACAWHLNGKGEARPYTLADVLVPDTMLEFIRGEQTSMAFARATIDTFMAALSRGDIPAGLQEETLLYPVNSVRLRAPVPRPASLRSLIGSRGADDQFPTYATLAHQNITGSDEDVIWPSFTEKIDFGLELAWVIGKMGRNVRAEIASGFIAGYTVMNNFLAWDIMGRELPVRQESGKHTDWCTSIGPVLVTPDEIGDPSTLSVRVRVNNEPRSTGTTGAMQWRPEDIIEFLSREETLYPGDVVGCGAITGGCGRDLGLWVRPGDVIELEIEKIGVLRNRVVRDAPPSS
jgi:2-keto-4-pentenoate hydratase/2-oxohepta-3-ene-1,7-dioic acid hydratase in catechol pathway